MNTQDSLKRYRECINRALTYICRNVGQPIRLDELAEDACFSKFHFLRIFKAVVGESVGDFIRRIRIEKSAYYLVYSPALAITTIALENGFSSSQNFAKSFHAYYGMSPRAFRAQSRSRPLHHESNPGNIMRTGGEESHTAFGYIDVVAGRLPLLEPDLQVARQVTIENVGEQRVAYVRKNENYTPAHVAAAFEELYSWAKPRGLLRVGAVRCIVPRFITLISLLTGTASSKGGFPIAACSPMSAPALSASTTPSTTVKVSRCWWTSAFPFETSNYPIAFLARFLATRLPKEAP